jgi:flagellar biogenesis protein FliO
MNLMSTTIAFASALPLDSGIDYVRVVLSLLVCLALGVGAAFALRRLGRYRAPTARIRQLEVLESVRLDARTSLHLVRCGDGRTLVACGPGAVALARVEDVVAPTAPVAGAAHEA